MNTSLTRVKRRTCTVISRLAKGVMWQIETCLNTCIKRWASISQIPATHRPQEMVIIVERWRKIKCNCKSTCKRTTQTPIVEPIWPSKTQCPSTSIDHSTQLTTPTTSRSQILTIKINIMTSSDSLTPVTNTCQPSITTSNKTAIELHNPQAWHHPLGETYLTKTHFLIWTLRPIAQFYKVKLQTKIQISISGVSWWIQLE